MKPGVEVRLDLSKDELEMLRSAVAEWLVQYGKYATGEQLRIARTLLYRMPRPPAKASLVRTKGS